jgi:streptogramin lyase
MSMLRGRLPIPTALLIPAIAVLAWAGAAAAQTVQEFALPSGMGANLITTLANGSVWFTTASGFATIDSTGKITVVASLPSGYSGAGAITAGPDGALWFTLPGDEVTPGTPPSLIGRVGSDGSVTTFALPVSPRGFNYVPFGLATGSDGALWFNIRIFDNAIRPITDADKIGRIDTSGNLTFFPEPYTIESGNFKANFNSLAPLVPGPDRALWLAETSNGMLARVSTDGSFTTIPTTVTSAFAQMVAGPDGAFWHTEGENGAQSAVGRLQLTGQSAEFPTPLAGSNTQAITVGADGALYFTESFADQIGRITTGGSLTEFAIPTPSSNGNDRPSITGAPDGSVYFTEPFENQIGRFVPAPASQTLTVAETGSGGGQVTSSPAGITCSASSNQCAAPFTAGTQVTLTASASAGSTFAGWSGGGGCTGTGTCAVTLGANTTVTATFNVIPSFMLSVAPSGTGSGTVTSTPSGITCGATCAASFQSGTQVTLTAAAANGSTFAGWTGGGCSGTQTCAVTLGANTTVNASFVADTAANLTLVAAVLPTSRSVAVGNTATAFATMIDAGPADASTCTIAPVTTIAASFVFQTTNPATNALTGTANTPANIAAGQAQSFVIALTPTAAFAPTNVAFAFTCANAPAPAATTVGVDTLNLSGSTTPVPDIVALAASGDPGFVDIPGATGTGVFAVATVNLGADATITAAANTGTANLPVTLTICQTNPQSGACLAAPTPSVTTDIPPNATPTFGIFVTGSAAVANLPGVNRVFVTFTDGDGALRGETSVAVRTQ